MCFQSFEYFFQNKINKNGYIKKGKYEGWYSIIDEAFVPSSQIKEIKEGNKVKMVKPKSIFILYLLLMLDVNISVFKFYIIFMYHVHYLKVRKHHKCVIFTY